MILASETARKTAELLLQIKAIKLQPNAPFTWASGWKSPIYCDNRLTLSYPEVRKFMYVEMAKQILNHYGKPDIIAGVATGAIAIGALVAEELGLPFIYIRSKAKEHGRQNLIEGHLPENQRVVVVEDLISTGGSSLQAVSALKDAGAQVLGMIGIFSYGFSIAEENFLKADCQLLTLSDYQHLIEQAAHAGYISSADIDLLTNWRTNPAEWHKE